MWLQDGCEGEQNGVRLMMLTRVRLIAMQCSVRLKFEVNIKRSGWGWEAYDLGLRMKYERWRCFSVESKESTGFLYYVSWYFWLNERKWQRKKKIYLSRKVATCNTWYRSMRCQLSRVKWKARKILIKFYHGTMGIQYRVEFEHPVVIMLSGLLSGQVTCVNAVIQG